MLEESRRIAMHPALVRRRFVGGCLAGLFTATAGCQSIPGTESSGAADVWPTTGFDPANTGFAPDRSAVPDAGRVRWKVDANDAPVAVNEMVFQRRAARTAAGEPEWRTSPASATSSMPAPTYHDDVLYVLDGIPLAYETDEGTERWRQDEVTGGVGAPRVTDDGVFGVTTGRTRQTDAPTVFRLDPATGTPDWQHYLPVDPTYTPALGHETIVTAGRTRSWDGGVIAAYTTDGSERWQFRLDGSLWAEPTIGDGAVFVADRAGSVTALALETGDVRWQRDFDGAPKRFCYGDGHLYAFADGLRALDPADGRTVWRTETGGDPVCIDADAIYCVGDDEFSTPRFLRVIDRDTRSETWSYEFPTVARGDIVTGGVRGRPALVDGAMFVAAADGLHAFEPEST